MKTKYILFLLTCFAISFNAEAQFLKKLKKKAQQAAERTILKKTDEVVTKKTEKAIDGATSEKKDSSKTVMGDGVGRGASGSTLNGGPGDQTKRNAINETGNLKGSMLPNSYAFDWEYKTEIVIGKKEKINIDYLINSNTKDYFGMSLKTEETQQYDMLMLMDNKLRVSTMLMDVQGQKMAQMTKMPEVKNKGTKTSKKVDIEEIGTKTILGYKCYGIKASSTEYVVTLYYTLDAEISFSSLFNMTNSKSAPKGFDPALLEVLNEEGLLMEMTAKSENDDNESFYMNAKSLDRKRKSINMKEYKENIMPLGGLNFKKGF